ncbi:DUF131 domain-containing protein [Candidatus Woesearchaeota archaeon]|nr:DUF131 domain-containing protein [Candidatus Woesearchaeota archaeon]
MVTQTQLIQAGMLLILAGFVMLFAASFFPAKERGEKSDVKFSAFGIIGFIPFGFGNDKRLFAFTVVLTLVMMALLFYFYRKGL